jgi:hypothetical protein
MEEQGVTLQKWHDIQDGFSYGNIAVIKPTTDKCNFDIVQRCSLMNWHGNG